MGQLILDNMEFYAHHGHFDEEQTIGGRFTVTLVIDTDFTKAAEADDLKDALDYSRIYVRVRNEMEKPSRLLENLAKRIVDAVYKISDRITRITVTVSKLNPVFGGNMERFTVVLSR
jgi:7,8-dihydroneopterin aldolase/epimerase/oxygenase